MMMRCASHAFAWLVMLTPALSASVSSAQDAPKVTGTVALAGRLAPLGDVPLALCRIAPEEASSEDEACLRTLTDQNGNFAFNEVSPGTYDLIGQSYSKREFGATIEVVPESKNYFMIMAPN
jgi:hypothetical protein